MAERNNTVAIYFEIFANCKLSCYPIGIQIREIHSNPFHSPALNNCTYNINQCKFLSLLMWNILQNLSLVDMNGLPCHIFFLQFLTPKCHKSKSAMFSLEKTLYCICRSIFFHPSLKLIIPVQRVSSTGPLPLHQRVKSSTSQLVTHDHSSAKCSIGRDLDSHSTEGLLTEHYQFPILNCQ